MNNCPCVEVLFNLDRLGRDKRTHVSAHATLLLDNWQSLQKEWKMSASFCKDQRCNLKCTRRQHTLCILRSCGIDVMPSFSWFQICPLTAIDKSGISACADIWRGAHLNSQSHVANFTWAWPRGLQSAQIIPLHFVKNFALFWRPCLSWAWSLMGHSVRKCWTLSP